MNLANLYFPLYHVLKDMQVCNDLRSGIFDAWLCMLSFVDSAVLELDGI